MASAVVNRRHRCRSARGRRGCVSGPPGRSGRARVPPKSWAGFARKRSGPRTGVGQRCASISTLGSEPRFDAAAQELFDGWRADLEHRLRAEEDEGHSRMNANSAWYDSIDRRWCRRALREDKDILRKDVPPSSHREHRQRLGGRLAAAWLER